MFGVKDQWKFSENVEKNVLLILAGALQMKHFLLCNLTVAIFDQKLLNQFIKARLQRFFIFKAVSEEGINKTNVPSIFLVLTQGLLLLAAK